jgi:hypothetical protein
MIRQTGSLTLSATHVYFDMQLVVVASGGNGFLLLQLRGLQAGPVERKIIFHLSAVPSPPSFISCCQWTAIKGYQRNVQNAYNAIDGPYGGGFPGPYAGV